MKVVAHPSREFDAQITEAESLRVEEQRGRLGPEGLRAAGESARRAVESQRLPPMEVLEKVPMADVDGIVFRRMSSHDLADPGTDPAPGGFDLRSGTDFFSYVYFKRLATYGWSFLYIK